MTRKICARLSKFIHRTLHSEFEFQALAFGFLVFFVMSFRPTVPLGGGEPFGFDVFGTTNQEFQISEPGFFDNFAGISTAGIREVLVEDESGNLVVKIQPRKRDRTVSYLVKSGDNISKIAHKFNLEIRTILWANDLTVRSTLRVGQKLKIPPADGVFFTVRPGDTLSEIAKLHNIDLAKIYAYNSIKKGKIRAGQTIFLPEAQRIFVAKKPPTAGRPGSKSRAIQSIGFRLRKPTQGILTQGFHRGHYALDIANKRNTPIYAAAAGTVKKATNSGWNYGYGKYIVIDHGNGVETLYAHNNLVKVSVGDKIRAGQLIALMGNTGRVFGVTGIHVHFELRIRGRKVNPQSYF